MSMIWKGSRASIFLQVLENGNRRRNSKTVNGFVTGGYVTEGDVPKVKRSF